MNENQNDENTDETKQKGAYVCEKSQTEQNKKIYLKLDDSSMTKIKMYKSSHARDQRNKITHPHTIQIKHTKYISFDELIVEESTVSRLETRIAEDFLKLKILVE